MWKSNTRFRHMLAIIPFLLLTVLAASAAGQDWSFDSTPAEDTKPAMPSMESTMSSLKLNGIPIGADFLYVMGLRGQPHYVGPSLETADQIENILNPPPKPPPNYIKAKPPAVAKGGTTGPPTVTPPPDLPIDPPVVPVSPTGPPPTLTLGPGEKWRPFTPPGPPLGTMNYVMFMYEGNTINKPDPLAGWTTFVLLGKDSGKVESVVLWLEDPGTWLSTPALAAKLKKIQMPGKVPLGSTLSYLIAINGYPTPLAKVGDKYLCPYPDLQITYTVDIKMNKVIGISVGANALTVLQPFKTAKPAKPGAPGKLPGPPQNTLPGSSKAPVPPK